MTPKPGGGSWFIIGYAVLLFLILGRFAPIGEERQQLWDEGTPVVLQVLGEDPDGSVVIQEYGTSSRWTSPADQLPTAEVGASIQARFVGPDQRIMFEPSATGAPRWMRLMPLVLVAMAVPGLLARSRWGSIGRVLAMTPRRVRIEPAWVRGSFAPRTAVRVSDLVPEGTDTGSDIIVEVKGTPVTWWALAVQDLSQNASAYGPDASGLMVIETDAGRAVPSSSPRRGDRAKKTVCPWSQRLSVEIGLVQPPATKLTVGGTDRQRVSLSGDVALTEGAQAFAMDMRLVRRRTQLYPLAISVVVLVVVLFVRSSALTPILYASGLIGVALVRWWGARALAGRPPLADWTDRRAAREAGHAAFAIGLRPARADEVR